mmetsp:Transcript_62419/g.129502  ORF Transcript_62419/g.129502 Transcript_62419/m.129502 type:complete len:104 (+) Transcript_62419:310-621(+)
MLLRAAQCDASWQREHSALQAGLGIEGSLATAVAHVISDVTDVCSFVTQLSSSRSVVVYSFFFTRIYQERLLRRSSMEHKVVLQTTSRWWILDEMTRNIRKGR